MNFAKAYQEELDRGKEPDPAIPPPNTNLAQEARVSHIHNDWIKHQCTQDLVKTIKFNHDKILAHAKSLSSKHENSQQVMYCLQQASALESVLKTITNYGKFDTN